MRRTPGTSTGVLLFLLGIWGAVVPFVGSYFSFGYTPHHSWTTARIWLEILPGAAVAVGGLVLVLSARAYLAAVAGAWLGILGGAWFVVGGQLAVLLHTGSVGQPAGHTEGRRVLEALAYFYGLGALVILLASFAAGRLSIHRVLAQPVERGAQPVAAYPADSNESQGPGARSATREDQKRHAHLHFGEQQGRGTVPPSAPSDTPPRTEPADASAPQHASPPQQGR
jgi:hypothetical protein